MASVSRRFLRGLDMYRKVPIDLLEGTKRGNFLSYAAIILMITLFTLETKSFLSSSFIKTDIYLDNSKEKKIRVNFNITMLDMPCEYAVIDAKSSMGTAQNVMQYVTKYNLDSTGVRARYNSRNKDQHDISLEDALVVDSLEELHANGEDAISLDENTLRFARDEYEFLFVDFYASWCSHCVALAPTWEVLAEAMSSAATVHMEQNHKHILHSATEDQLEEALKIHMPVVIAKVDCVQHDSVCREQNIRGYPTLRLFVRGKHDSDYHGDREVLEFIHWLEKKEEEHKKDREEHEKGKVKIVDEIARTMLNVTETKAEMLAPPKGADDDDLYAGRKSGGQFNPSPDEQKIWAEKVRKIQNRQLMDAWNEKNHPGCQLSGYLYVDRVPGNFHIHAQSNKHDIAPQMTNVSHIVHHLSFGHPHVNSDIKSGKISVPDGFSKSLTPIDGNAYVNHNEHEAFHHYLKVVTTNLEDPFSTMKDHLGRKTEGPVMVYSLLSSSHLSFYRNDVVPEARFVYDPSPISVYHRYMKHKKWYDYLTSMMAIIGGTFTVLGMVENSLNSIHKRR